MPGPDTTARHHRDDWPIAAAMIQYPDILTDGSSAQDRPAEAWAATFVDIGAEAVSLGLIDDRTAIELRLGHCYDSPFLVEDYGGDGVSVSATDRDDLRRILPRASGAPRASGVTP